MNVILLLLSAQLSTEISLDFLAESDSEWVAPGWEVFEEIEINPLDYVEPLWAAPNAIACQAFEVRAGDSSRTWRLVICGSDRIVAFQGNWNQERTLELPFQPGRMNCSQNGRYAIAYPAPGYNEDTCVVADLETWQLDDVITQRGGQGYLPNFMISGLGKAVRFYCGEIGPIVLTDSSGSLPIGGDWESLVALRAPVLSPDRDCFYSTFDVGLPGYSPDDLGAFDLDGNLIWSRHGFQGIPVVSPDGSVVLVYGPGRRLYALRADDGSLLACETTDCHWQFCSGDNRPLVYKDLGQDGAIGIALRPVDREESTGSLAYSISSGAFFWRSTSSDGYLLGEIYDYGNQGTYGSSSHKLVLVSPDGSLVWASETHNEADSELDFRGNEPFFNNQLYGSRYPFAVVSSGDSIYVISAPRQVTITGIRRVE